MPDTQNTRRNAAPAQTPRAAALVLLLTLTLAGGPAWAALTVSKTTDLSFGSMVAGGTSGTVTMSTTGVRSAGGGVYLITQGAGATGSRAVFTVSGGPTNTQCDITLPNDGVVSLTGTGSPMAVNSIASSPSTLITLDGSGGGTIDVGGVLSVGASKAPGSYSDTSNLSLTVTCP